MKETLISGINLGVKSNFFSIQVELNKKNLNILRYLYQNGLINSYSILKSNKKISLFFSYYYDKKPILYVKKISKSGRKIYVSWKTLKNWLVYKNHYLILSTDQGIFNNREAISRKLGGELLFLIKC